MAVRRAFAPPGIVVILHPERSPPSRRYTTRIALPRRHAAATIDGEKPLDFGKPILMIFGGLFCIRSIPSPDGSELCFCPTTFGLSDKNARPAGPVRRSRVAPLFFDDDMGKKKVNQSRSHKYSFRLNEEQNLRFSQMLREAGCEGNRSRFIVRRLFGEPFTVIKRDPTKAEFVARLHDFNYQLQRIGNNYNQVVKAINTHFSTATIPRQIAALEQRTAELKAVSVEIVNLTKRLAEQW